MTIQLKTTKIELKEVSEKAEVKISKGRYTKFDIGITHISKKLLGNLIDDYKVMQKALKKHGVKSVHALHYNETPEFKKGLKEKDIPNFLKSKKKRERL